MRYIVSISLFLLVLSLYSQDAPIAEIENNIKNYYGLEKLEKLNILTDYYSSINVKKAIRFGKQSRDLSKNLYGKRNELNESESLELLKSHFYLARAYFLREDFVVAKTEFELAHEVLENHALDTLASNIADYLNHIHTAIQDGDVKNNVFKKTFGKIKVGEAVRETRKDISIETQISRAKSHKKSGEFDEAVAAYELAINLLKDKGKPDRIADLQMEISLILDSLGRHQEDLERLENVPLEDSKIKSIAVIPSDSSEESPPAIHNDELKDLERSLIVSKEEKVALKRLSDEAIKSNNIKDAIDYLKRYQELSQKILRDSVQTELLRKESEQAIVYLQQQKRLAEFEVKDAKIQQTKQRRIKNFISLITALLLILATAIFYFYRSKKHEHQKLTGAYADLDEAKKQLEKAEFKIKRMLEQQVSSDIATTLLGNQGSLGESKFAAILFLDIQDFTPLAEKLTPKELIAYQNKVFGFMIDTIEEYKGNVNQLLGDGFMATFGAPISHGNDCQHAFQAAQVILDKVGNHSEAGDIPKTRVRIGIHAGTVVTGNVGNETRKQFSVTGNAVITSARLEQLNKDFSSSLIVSKEFFEHINDEAMNVSYVEKIVRLKGRQEKMDILVFNT